MSNSIKPITDFQGKIIGYEVRKTLTLKEAEEQYGDLEEFKKFKRDSVKSAS